MDATNTTGVGPWSNSVQIVTRLDDSAIGAIDCLKMDALGLGMASFGTDNDGERCYSLHTTDVLPRARRWMPERIPYTLTSNFNGYCHD
jgi:hypothetical protein